MNHCQELIDDINPMYYTNQGAAYCGNSLDLLAKLPDNSVSLVITSPPFALLRKKEYGNEEQSNYVEWLAQFGKLVYKKLKDNGSFVIDIGGAYQKGVPVRSLYNFKVPIYFVEELGYYLAEDFYWFNPAKLPSPIEWVNKKKIRVKDSVNNVWWFSKSEYPKADTSKVLAPYSDRMKKLLENPEKYYEPKKRPSGHDIGESFAKDNGGAIPSNLLQISNSESNTKYMGFCKKLEINSHPARFPSKLPKFFIEFLTDEGDLVVDIFAGSNTTGEIAEKLNRPWLSFELDKVYAAASAFRFIGTELPDKKIFELYNKLLDMNSIDLNDYILIKTLSF
jgi:site-specific DNA-methyltransferase (cytosine-N4-specific)